LYIAELYSENSPLVELCCVCVPVCIGVFVCIYTFVLTGIS